MGGELLIDDGDGKGLGVVFYFVLEFLYGEVEEVWVYFYGSLIVVFVYGVLDLVVVWVKGKCLVIVCFCFFFVIIMIVGEGGMVDVGGFYFVMV